MGDFMYLVYLFFFDVIINIKKVIILKNELLNRVSMFE